MSLLRKLHLLKSLLTAVLAAPLLMSCYNYDHEEVEMMADASEKYINLTIAVSAESQGKTRAPLGGENGDGREAGFQRENMVSGITLILYEDATGINTTANPTLAFVKYYPTTLISYDAAGSPQTETTHYSGADKNDLDEAYYTTGDQLVPKGSLTFGKPYRAIVVANRDLTSDISTSSHLNDVKALVYGADDLYDGDYGKAAYACRNFMMSSEYDFQFDLTAPTAIEPNKAFYRPTDSNPIRIERLAARIDFWAAGATYQETGIYGGRSGYVYNVGTSGDKFVVVSITPFNLYSKGTTYGGEKLLKQLNTGYLLDETTTNYVIDPSTASKTTTNVSAFATDGTYLNPLSQIFTDLNASSPKTMSAAGIPAYYQTVKAMHDKIESQGGFGSGFDNNLGGSLKGENVIVAYPMENTLPYEATPSTPLYTYATGVAIEGDYYAGGDLTAAPTATRVYIGYLMHQSGSAATYTPFKSDDPDVQTAVPSTTAMNYGVVRNNIYRISIESITPEGPIGPKIKIKIQEEKWRHVDNPTIYI
jgi:hypothetical protein